MTIGQRADAVVAALAVDRNRDVDAHPGRRRWIVLAVLVVGACLLGVSLSVSPGDGAFYPLTIGLAAVWAVGAMLSGPIPIGRFGSAAAPARATTAGAGLLGIGTGLLVGACFLLGAVVTRPIPGLGDLVNRVLAFADHGSIAVITLITLGNGLAEELFFRGAVYSAVRRWHPVVVSTAIYAAVTLASGNPMLGFAGVVLGVVCAILRRCTGGVLAPGLTHLGWGAIMLFALPPIFA
ncbi:MAG: type II CAAX endopeptidase family protein [Gordonia sp. (in: high G+C Gram-positive bacteria)]